MDITLKETERIDDLQRNGYRIIQDSKRFCFGMDAVLLSGFASESSFAGNARSMLDLGTGTGILPILLAAKTSCRDISALEIQEESADMAQRSVLLNDLTDRINIITGDLKEADQIFPLSSFDMITCNPPYMIGGHGITNPDSPKAIARHEVACTLEDVLKVTEKLLRPDGHFFMVHRPFRLAEILSKMIMYHLEPKRLRLVYPMIEKEPTMILVEGVRNGNSGMTVEAPLIIFEKPGEYTQEIREKYGF